MSTGDGKDIVVIGGGPAGLTTCFWLQKLGIGHILIEKENYPRDKACADVLTSNAIRIIHEIDEGFIPEMLSLGILKPIYGTDLSTSNNHTISLNFKWLDDQKGTPSCYSIKRIEFDHFLFEKLCHNPLTTSITGRAVKDIQINDQSCQVQLSDGSNYQSKLVLVATGSNFNPLENRGKLEDQHIAVGVRAYYKSVDSRSNFCELFLHKKLMPGGIYIAPIEEDVFNVNIVVRSDHVKKKRLNLKKELEEMIHSNELLKDRFKNAKRIGSYVGSSLILGTKKREICGDRFMLVGDSAGLIDLISANGIPQAMLSGKMAAQQAFECLKSNNFSKEFMGQYEVSLFKAIKSDLSLGRTINPILKFDFVNKLTMALLNLVSKSSSKNSTLVKVFYSKRPALLFINPKFYYNLLKDSLSSK